MGTFAYGIFEVKQSAKEAPMTPFERQAL